MEVFARRPFGSGLTEGRTKAVLTAGGRDKTDDEWRETDGMRKPPKASQTEISCAEMYRHFLSVSLARPSLFGYTDRFLPNTA